MISTEPEQGTRLQRVIWRIEFRLVCGAEGIYQAWFAMREMKASNYDG